MKIENLEGEEAKQAIKDSETMYFDDFVKKYNTSQFVGEVTKIIDKLKEKVEK